LITVACCAMCRRFCLGQRCWQAATTRPLLPLSVICDQCLRCPVALKNRDLALLAADHRRRWGTDRHRRWGTDHRRRWGIDHRRRWGIERMSASCLTGRV
jgi:hypothetical protein